MSARNQTIAKNTIILYVRMMIVTLIALYSSRLVLKVLGVDDYGIYNIAGGIVSFFAVVNTALSSSVQRFLNIDLGNNNLSSFHCTLNIGIQIHLIVGAAILILGETIGVYAYYHWLNIPTDREFEGFIVYQFSLFSAAISVMKTPYNAVIIAKEKMAFFAYLSIGEAVMKLLAIASLFYMATDYLIVYALSIFLIGVAVFMATYLYCRHSLGVSAFHYEPMKSGHYKEMVKFSGWNFFGNLSIVFTWQGISVILNIFFGVAINAAVGVTNQVANTISSFINNFQVAYKPTLIQLYVQNMESFQDLLIRTSKFSFLLLFLVLYPIYFNIDGILSLWLDNPPLHSGNFIKILLISILLSSINLPFYTALEASQKIAAYQITATLITPVALVYSYIILHCGYSADYVMLSHIMISVILLATSVSMCIRLNIIKLSDTIIKVIFPALKVTIFCLFVNTILPRFSIFLDISIKLLVALIAIILLGMNNAELKAFLHIALRKIGYVNE